MAPVFLIIDMKLVAADIIKHAKLNSIEIPNIKMKDEDRGVIKLYVQGVMIKIKNKELNILARADDEVLIFNNRNDLVQEKNNLRINS